MNKLIKAFKCAPSNEWQELFLEWEAELLTHNSGYSYHQSKMRGHLLGWVEDEVRDYGIEIDTLDGKITVLLGDKSMSIEWTEADKLLDVIESVKSEEAMKNLWEGME